MPNSAGQGSGRPGAMEWGTRGRPRHRAGQTATAMVTRTSRRLSATLAALAVVMAAFLIGGVASAGAQTGAPVNSTSPSLAGTALDGKKLKANKGSWTGLTPIQYAYQWLRCTSSGQECTEIPSAEQVTYKLTGGDVGKTLRVRVTASNTEGSTVASSPPSGAIASAAPKRKKTPVISGNAQDGQLLTAGNGTWKGTAPFSYTYQWEACRGTACTLVAGATGSTYRPTTPELGEKLRVLVTATNASGTARSLSKPSAKVVAGPPVAMSAPTVTGTPLVGQQLSAGTGGWAGTGPFEYSYQWRSCNLLGECTDIAGANQPTYDVAPLDVANGLEVVVTATNPLGSASATSEQTSLIKALLPSNTGLPSITGLLQDGGLLSALTGSWSGTGPLSFSYAGSCATHPAEHAKKSLKRSHRR